MKEDVRYALVLGLEFWVALYFLVSSKGCSVTDPFLLAESFAAAERLVGWSFSLRLVAGTSGAWF